jgi:sugar lactone lactonase YvrE
MRRALRFAVLAALLAAPLAGCGAKFDLPTETSGGIIPGDGSYQMLATWSGMDGVNDILLTQGAGTQLFILFNHGGTGTAPRGEVLSYARSRPTSTPDPLPGIAFPTVFNPVALAAGGNRIFVLDRGDTCLARTNPASGSCADQPGWGRRITDLSLYWRVREYGLLGGDTVTTFTDTTVAYVNGIAADAQGNVYVSGVGIILVPDPNDARIRTRTFQFAVYKYSRGPRYPGVVPNDHRMPGAAWHRDTAYVVEEGSGVGSILDARGLFWSAAGGEALYVSDFGKNWVQKVSDRTSSTGFYQLDGSQSGVPFNGPVDVTVDLQGFVYVADPGNRRVLRYSPSQEFVQVVNVEPDAQGQELQDPVAVAADDSLVFIAERTLGKVIRYKKRP